MARVLARTYRNILQRPQCAAIPTPVGTVLVFQKGHIVDTLSSRLRLCGPLINWSMWPPSKNSNILQNYVIVPTTARAVPKLFKLLLQGLGPSQNDLMGLSTDQTVTESSFNWPLQNCSYTLHYTRSQTIRHKLKLNQLVCVLVYQPVSDKQDWYVYLFIVDVGIMFAYHILSMKLCLSAQKVAAGGRWRHRPFNRLHLVYAASLNQPSCERELAKPPIVRLVLYPSVGIKFVLRCKIQID